MFSHSSPAGVWPRNRTRDLAFNSRTPHDTNHTPDASIARKTKKNSFGMSEWIKSVASESHSLQTAAQARVNSYE